MKIIRVLFICMGNICRSPTAEAVFRARVEEAGLAQHILIDSAGTHDYHIGDPPDMRTQRAAQQRGYDMSGLRGRQVGVADFTRFDYVLAMDHANLAILQRLCPQAQRERLGLFLEYASRHAEREVPDPYYGGAAGFERVLDMVEDAAEGLLGHIRKSHLGAFLQFRQEAQMELCKKNDNMKIIAAIVCLFIGFLFIWNIAAHISDIYELRLDTETCNQVKTLGLAPSANCVVTAPYRPFGLGPGGYLILPGGNDIQIVPIAANQTNKSAEWSISMKVQFWAALLFWVATLALLLSTLRDKK